MGATVDATIKVLVERRVDVREDGNGSCCCPWKLTYGGILFEGAAAVLEYDDVLRARRRIAPIDRSMCPIECAFLSRIRTRPG
jgi:hypothetical protein